MRRPTCFLLALTLVPYAATAGPADDLDWSRYFGFAPMEIYRISRDISNLRLADVTGDGRTDVLLWNGERNRFELFYQPDPNAPASDEQEELERNELPNRGALRNVHVPVAYRVASLDVGEFTGDGRPDIVFFGEPREVVILPGEKDNTFGPAMPMRVPEGDPRAGNLAVADFNHDGRQDVAVLGENALLVLLQRAGGGFGKPLRLVHNVPQTLLMLPGDFNGDGRDDLIIGVDDEQYGALVFLQDESGTLGAMRRIRVPQLRSITVAKHADGDDIFSVEGATGRLRKFRWQTPEKAATYSDWPQWLYSFPIEITSKRQPVAVGDLTGDGKLDVVVAAPDASQVVLFAGGATGLRPGVAFPGLQKTGDLAIADVDGDDEQELLSISPDEKMIGISEYEDGRITFPQAEGSVGTAKALVATCGPLLVNGKDQRLAYLCRVEPPAGSSDKAKIELRLVPREGKATTVEVDKLADEPEAVRLADLNQDGRNDVLLFIRYAPPMVFLQTEGGGFEKFDGPGTRSELVKEARTSGCEFVDVDGDNLPEVVLAQKNMARALAIRDGRWAVIDQYNPESSDAEITGLAFLPPAPGSAGPPRPRLVMYDRKGQELLVLTAGENSAYSVTGRIPAGQYDVQAMTAGALGPNGKLALLLVDAKKLALFTPDDAAPTLVDVQTYETKIKDAFPADSTVGDLNGDGRRDVVLVDTRKANLEILTTLDKGELHKVLHFQVFQGKRFSGQPDVGGQPREVLVGDVDGNQRADIVLLVHDRLIVYPSQ